ncbi:MAG: hypothetical protein ACUVXI_05125 [bacterium]
MKKGDREEGLKLKVEVIPLDRRIALQFEVECDGRKGEPLGWSRGNIVGGFCESAFGNAYVGLFRDKRGYFWRMIPRQFARSLKQIILR